jgi:hypothetical protein
MFFRYTSLMPLHTSLHQPGKRVRVTQQIAMRDDVFTNTIEGVIQRYQQAKTGSWFAHAKDDQLWLDRLELRLDDGEVSILNLDQYTVIEELPDDHAASPSAGATS